MKLKTSTLIGPALDFAVGMARGRKVYLPSEFEAFKSRKYGDWWADRKYSTNWQQGGPIIEREKIGVVWRDLGQFSYWCAFNGPDFEGKGNTQLIAAMRCYVASKLGDIVEIPNELIT